MYYAAFCSSTGPAGQHWAILVQTPPGPGLAPSRHSCLPPRPSPKRGDVHEQGKLHQAPQNSSVQHRSGNTPGTFPSQGHPTLFQAAWGLSARLEPGCKSYTSLLWTSLNTEAWTFPSGFPKAEQTCYPLVSPALPKWRGGHSQTEGSQRIMGSLFLYNHRNHQETQDHTSSKQDFISQGFIWMLPPESQIRYLHYPLSTSPQNAAETQVT